jgi:pimeloyl-ACP methyl ester carboxylesterase
MDPGADSKTAIYASVVTLLFLSGCGGNAEFQQHVPIVPCAKGQRASQDVPIFPIEFDDQGVLFDQNQLAVAQRKIEASRSGNPVVVIFVHGWLNNASDCSGALVGFEDVLRTRQALEQDYSPKLIPPREPREIIGIYIGWRGLSMQAGYLNLLTFWGREAAAARIAQSSLVDVITALAESAKGQHARSQVVLIGHSFGGAIVERAMTQLIVARLGLIASAGGGPVSLPIDLTVLVNPASSALDTWRLVNTLMERNARFEQQTYSGNKMEQRGAGPVRPIMVSVTAENDDATGYFFPLGQRLYAYQGRVRSLDGGRFDEGELYRQTGGHTPRLFSHTIKRMGPPPPGVECHDLHPTAFTGDDRNCYIVEFRYDWNRSPYWVMQVPKPIVNGHNGIYARALGDMVVALLDAYGQDGGPVETKLTATGTAAVPSPPSGTP